MIFGISAEPGAPRAAEDFPNLAPFGRFVLAVTAAAEPGPYDHRSFHMRAENQSGPF
jgi:hypothetical protein